MAFGPEFGRGLIWTFVIPGERIAAAKEASAS